MLKGIDIILYEKTKTGEDGFHDPIYEENPVTVHNVLVGQPTAEEITTELQLTGRRIAYTLAIPKGDTHNRAAHRLYAGNPKGRYPQLGQRPGGVFRADLPHLRRGCAGHRGHDPAALE